MQVTLQINLLDLIVAQNSIDQLSLAKSYNHSSKMMFCYTMKFPPYRQNRRLSKQLILFTDP